MNPGEKIDAFYRGRVRVIQSRTGYRFAVDAPLLADFVRTGPGEELVELGTGNGIVALLLSLKPWRRLTAVEIQPALAGLARRNVALNGLEGRIEVVEADFREFRPGRRFDVVLSNPPYIRKGTGFLGRSDEKAIAKHELKCDIYQVLRAAADLLKPSGRADIVFPAEREDELRAAAARNGLQPRLRRAVHPREGEPAGLLLVELGVGDGESRDLEPLILRGADGADSAEAAAIYEGRTRDPLN